MVISEIPDLEKANFFENTDIEVDLKNQPNHIKPNYQETVTISIIIIVVI